MTVELKERPVGIKGIRPRPADRLTPEQEVQYMKDLLMACHDNIDTWMMIAPGMDDAEKVAAVRLRMSRVLTQMLSPQVAVDPTYCYYQYSYCVSHGGSNCAQLLADCLANISGAPEE